jgi:hypothetical protein
MNERLRLVGALTLVAVGLLCIVYALAKWENAEPAPRDTTNPPLPVHDPALPDPNAQPGYPAAPANAQPGAPVVAPPAGAVQAAPSGQPGRQPAQPNDIPPVPVRTLPPPLPEPVPDDGASTGHGDQVDDATAAGPVGRANHAADAPPGNLAKPHKEAVKLWVVAGLPLVFVGLIVIILALRWFRPKPMPHTGPSDTTDLWQEAGKRFRLP